MDWRSDAPIRIDMIERLAALQGRLDEHPQALFERLLADVLVQAARPDFNANALVFLALFAVDQPFAGQILFAFHDFVYFPARDCRARRIRSSTRRASGSSDCCWATRRASQAVACG